MHSHVSIVHNGRQQYLHNVPREACQLLHSSGAIYVAPSVQINGVQPNSSSTHSITMAGRIGPQGTCEGTTYSDPYGTWSGVVVQAIVKITLKSYTVTVRLSDMKIILQLGQQCRWQSGHCQDNEDWHTYWEPAPTIIADFETMMYSMTAEPRRSQPKAMTSRQFILYQRRIQHSLSRVHANQRYAGSRSYTRNIPNSSS